MHGERGRGEGCEPQSCPPTQNTIQADNPPVSTRLALFMVCFVPTADVCFVPEPFGFPPPPPAMRMLPGLGPSLGILIDPGLRGESSRGSYKKVWR